MAQRQRKRRRGGCPNLVLVATLILAVICFVGHAPIRRIRPAGMRAGSGTAFALRSTNNGATRATLSDRPNTRLQASEPSDPRGGCRFFFGPFSPDAGTRPRSARVLEKAARDRYDTREDMQMSARGLARERSVRAMAQPVS